MTILVRGLGFPPIYRALSNNWIDMPLTQPQLQGLDIVLMKYPACIDNLLFKMRGYSEWRMLQVGTLVL